MKKGLALGALLVLAACTGDTFTGEDGGSDAPSDGTAKDGSIDAPLSDGESDGTTLEDAGDGGVATDAAPTCPVCEAGTTCCLIPGAANYGTCYATACLACCQ
ncbi:MAG TPA: hypothetical protein VLM85_20380 [Polyangiaceae bacterium]|nr:hypothetical protein [Polyangiaceae bacterium]